MRHPSPASPDGMPREESIWNAVVRTVRRPWPGSTIRRRPSARRQAKPMRRYSPGPPPSRPTVRTGRPEESQTRSRDLSTVTNFPSCRRRSWRGARPSSNSDGDPRPPRRRRGTASIRNATNAVESPGFSTIRTPELSRIRADWALTNAKGRSRKSVSSLKASPPTGTPRSTRGRRRRAPASRCAPARRSVASHWPGA